MSDPQIQPDHAAAYDGPHEGPIRTPKQLFLAVLYAFVIPIGVILLLVIYVSAQHRPAAGSAAMTPAAISDRVSPVGMVAVKDASDLTTLKSGEQVFAGQCSTCHTAGLLGAPKFGDAEAWAARIKTGYDALLNSALHGKGQMTAQGGGDYTDLEIGRAVVYMANKGGAHFDEPKPPADAASAVASAAAPAMAAAPEAAATPAAAMPAAATTAAATTTSTTAPATAAAPAATVVAMATPTKADAGAAPALFTQICQACHMTGAAGAPKLGDKAAWAPRLAQGIDGLTASAIKGKGAMPPKGGSNASEAEIKAVVTYMVAAVK